MEGPPLLDRISSQALARLAAQRPPTEAVTPAPEHAVKPRKRSWTRFLPYLFFGLSLFALWGMAFGVLAMNDDGWSWADAVQLALMAILVAGVISQARTMLRSTRAGRVVAARLPFRSEAPQPRQAPPLPPLDAVSAEFLSAVLPASVPGQRRTAAARRAGARAFGRFAVLGVVALSVLAFAGMVFALGYIVYAAGPWDPAVWLTAPFTGLTGFGVFQVFRSARRMAFRGRAVSLVTRSFRDSVRVWGSGSMVSKVAFTTTATASVAGAAVVPAVIQRDTDLDIFLRDSATETVFRIDLATDTSARINIPNPRGFVSVGFGTTPEKLALGDGRTLPKSSLITVLQDTSDGSQAVIAFRPGSATPVPVARVQPAIPGARFSAGPAALYAVQPDGSFWHVDLRTGAATRTGQLSVPAGPFTYEAETKSLVMVSGSEIVRLDPATGAVLARNPSNFAEGSKACGIADGAGGRLFVTIEGRPEILLVRTQTRSVTPIRPTGDAPAAPCELTVAARK